MENNSINNPENIQTQHSVLHKEDQQTYIATTEVIPSAQEKKWLVPVLILLLIVALASTAFFAYQNMQLKKQSDSITTAIFSPSPTSQLPLPSAPSLNNQIAVTNDFTYQNFKMTYPNDWIFSDMNSSNNFPLKERLQPLYEQGKVIALSKDGTYLIITIENASEGGAGGIFTSDQEYQQFLTDKDRLTIGNSTFYINKSRADIASLAESHAGPWMWGSVTEYIPSKTTESGNVFKGYENVIKRGGYAYNFIVVSNNGGVIEANLQREMISILETIKW